MGSLFPRPAFFPDCIGICFRSADRSTVWQFQPLSAARKSTGLVRLRQLLWRHRVFHGLTFEYNRLTKRDTSHFSNSVRTFSADLRSSCATKSNQV